MSSSSLSDLCKVAIYELNELNNCEREACEREACDVKIITKKIVTEDLGLIFEMAICLLYGIKYNGNFK